MKKINDAGLSLLKTHEGLRLQAYVCPGGVLTIGYGHTGDVKPLQQITKEAAEALLQQDVVRFERCINSTVLKPLTSNQFSALVCFVFNVGIDAFLRSTLLNLLNRGWYEQVPAQLMRWTHARGVELPGLITRRQDEAKLWNKEDADV